MNDVIDRASQFLKALSGRSRLLLLYHLADGEKSVGELAKLTEARDTAVSQQLALLRREGMVSARRAGQMIFYSIASDEATRMLDALNDMFCPSDDGKRQDAGELARREAEAV